MITLEVKLVSFGQKVRIISYVLSILQVFEIAIIHVAEMVTIWYLTYSCKHALSVKESP